MLVYRLQSSLHWPSSRVHPRSRMTLCPLYSPRQCLPSFSSLFGLLHCPSASPWRTSPPRSLFDCCMSPSHRPLVHYLIFACPRPSSSCMSRPRVLVSSPFIWLLCVLPFIWLFCLSSHLFDCCVSSHLFDCCVYNILSVLALSLSPSL